MQLYAKITKDVERLVDVIAEGRIVAFPTGTSYGLAVDALQGNALQRLRNAKGRDAQKSFTVFMREELWSTHLDVTDAEKSFLHQHAGKPLTLLVRPQKNLEHLAVDGRIGLRMIDHPVMQELSEVVDVPLTATSANIAGENACASVECITRSFPGLLDPTDTRHGDIGRAGRTTYDLSLGAIFDAGTLPSQKPSSIVLLQEDGSMKVIRQGEFIAKKN